eukprot:1065396-Pelagomonas_calceolata.AAC.8
MRRPGGRCALVPRCLHPAQEDKRRHLMRRVRAAQEGTPVGEVWETTCSQASMPSSCPGGLSVRQVVGLSIDMEHRGVMSHQAAASLPSSTQQPYRRASPTQVRAPHGRHAFRQALSCFS